MLSVLSTPAKQQQQQARGQGGGRRRQYRMRPYDRGSVSDDICLKGGQGFRVEARHGMAARHGKEYCARMAAMLMGCLGA